MVTTQLGLASETFAGRHFDDMWKNSFFCQTLENAHFFEKILNLIKMKTLAIIDF